MAIQSNQNGTFGIQLYTCSSTDTAPNSSAPAAARMRRLGKILPAVPQLTLYCMNGTSIVAVPWILEESTNLWIQASAALTSTKYVPATAATPRIDNAQIFWQITTNTGTVTQYGFIYG